MCTTKIQIEFVLTLLHLNEEYIIAYNGDVRTAPEEKKARRTITNVFNYFPASLNGNYNWRKITVKISIDRIAK